jgi:hypothetical protein
MEENHLYGTFNCFLKSSVKWSGLPFQHHRGLRQGDPLAPMLFILALEPLHKILTKAVDAKILSNVSQRADRMHTSFYADDASLFLNPVEVEVKSVFEIISFF